MRNVNTLEEVVAALNLTNGHIGDDHNNSRAAAGRVVTGVANLYTNGGGKIPVSFSDFQQFCLNEVYLNEAGLARISTRSVGGIINLRNGDLMEAIIVHNDESLDNLFYGSFLGDIYLLNENKQLVSVPNKYDEDHIRILQEKHKAAYEEKYGK